MVPASLVRVKFTRDYLEIREAHSINGSDHRVVVMHSDAESSGEWLSPPPPPHDNVKLEQDMRCTASPRVWGIQWHSASVY